MGTFGFSTGANLLEGAVKSDSFRLYLFVLLVLFRTHGVFFHLSLFTSDVNPPVTFCLLNKGSLDCSVYIYHFKAVWGFYCLWGWLRLSSSSIIIIIIISLLLLQVKLWDEFFVRSPAMRRSWATSPLWLTRLWLRSCSRTDAALQCDHFMKTKPALLSSRPRLQAHLPLLSAHWEIFDAWVTIVMPHLLTSNRNICSQAGDFSFDPDVDRDGRLELVFYQWSNQNLLSQETRSVDSCTEICF